MYKLLSSLVSHISHHMKVTELLSIHSEITESISGNVPVRWDNTVLQIAYCTGIPQGKGKCSQSAAQTPWFEE
jgi:hypothetical protein